MDRFSFIIYAPYNLALIGVVLLLLGVICAFTGKVIAPYHGVVRRTEDPSSFWWNVVIYFLVGVGFLAKFYLRVS